MKKKTLILMVLMLIAGTAYAGNVDLTAAWEQTDYERVDRWALFHSTTSGGPYALTGVLTKEEAEAGGGIVKEFNLESPDGQKITYYFTVVAYDEDMGIHSGNSNEVDFEVDFTPVPDPTTLTVTIKITSP